MRQSKSDMPTSRSSRPKSARRRTQNESDEISAQKRTDLMISVHPRHAENILSGQKTVEIRRRFSSDLPANSRVLIYETFPRQAIVGTANVERVERLSKVKLWNRYGKEAQVSRRLFREYLFDRKYAFAIVLRDARRLVTPVAIAQLRLLFDFYPPQSYCFLDSARIRLIQDVTGQTTDRHQHSDRGRGSGSSRPADRTPVASMHD